MLDVPPDLLAITAETRARLAGFPCASPTLLGAYDGYGLVQTGTTLSLVVRQDAPSAFAPLIDHTRLVAATTATDIDRLTNEAATHGFASVCVSPFWVERAASALAGTRIRVGTVVGFPLGASTTRSKAFETAEAVASGANEIDVVIALGAVKAGDWNTVLDDLRAVRSAAEEATMKVILETCLLSDEEKRRACNIAREANANFVKTSTGFASAGATVEDVALLRHTVGFDLGVKASGGIRTTRQALDLIFAGASRLGLSGSVGVISP
jgi:deoxyribose-phosphate aldolase